MVELGMLLLTLFIFSTKLPNLRPSIGHSSSSLNVYSAPLGDVGRSCHDLDD